MNKVTNIVMPHVILTRVEAEVHNHKVKNNLEVDIKELKTRRLWFLYTQQRIDHLERKKKKDTLVAELNSLRERWQPEMDQINTYKTASEDVKHRIKVEEDKTCSNSMRGSAAVGAKCSSCGNDCSKYKSSTKLKLRRTRGKQVSIVNFDETCPFFVN
ncbi:hypothetical protein FHG87_023060 [Trinorchestia longiramus]|nr:hypothetical protein FHG87_023060 [Trinorchestia longiramus]